MKIFLWTLASLIVLRTALGFVTFPVSILFEANLLVGSIFLGAPIVALFFAGKEQWTRQKALTFLFGGLFLQFGIVLLVALIPGVANSSAINLIVALSQAGLPIWTGGLGALIATLLKDKNMIVPIAITLAILDLFLVLTPIGTANQVMQKAPRVFTSVALNVPKVQSVEAPVAGGKLAVMGYAGPADFVFLGMFFVALFKYKMRTQDTLVALVPTLFFYLILSGIFKAPLPALVPIGIVILIVNRTEFHLSKDERIATATVGAIGIALLIFGMTRSGQLVAPLPRANGQVIPAPKGLPERLSQDQSQLPAPPVQGNTQGPL